MIWWLSGGDRLSEAHREMIAQSNAEAPLLVATARVIGATLLTRDRRIVGAGLVTTVA